LNINLNSVEKELPDLW